MAGDFDILAHLRNMRFGEGGGNAGGASKGPADGVNEKELPQMLVDAVGEKTPNMLTKLGLMPNFSALGSISIFQMFEKAEGWASAMINAAAQSMSSRGGFLAQLAHAVFLKNGAISDNTGGAGGGGGGGGGGGEGGGGGGGEMLAGGGGGHGGGGDFHGHGGHGGESMVAVSHGDKFTMVAVSDDMLGKLTPKATGDANFGKDSGVMLG